MVGACVVGGFVVVVVGLGVVVVGLGVVVVGLGVVVVVIISGGLGVMPCGTVTSVPLHLTAKSDRFSNSIR